MYILYIYINLVLVTIWCPWRRFDAQFVFAFKPGLRQAARRTTNLGRTLIFLLFSSRARKARSMSRPPTGHRTIPAKSSEGGGGMRESDTQCHHVKGVRACGGQIHVASIVNGAHLWVSPIHHVLVLHIQTHKHTRAYGALVRMLNFKYPGPSERAPHHSNHATT